MYSFIQQFRVSVLIKRLISPILLILLLVTLILQTKLVLLGKMGPCLKSSFCMLFRTICGSFLYNKPQDSYLITGFIMLFNIYSKTLFLSTPWGILEEWTETGCGQNPGSLSGHYVHGRIGWILQGGPKNRVLMFIN